MACIYLILKNIKMFLEDFFECIGLILQMESCDWYKTCLNILREVDDLAGFIIGREYLTKLQYDALMKIEGTTR